MLDITHIVGQILFGGYFIWSGINHFTSHRDFTAYAASKRVTLAGIAVYITGLLIILGGLSILFNLYTTIGLILIAVFLIPVTIVMHAFWRSDNPGEKAAQKIQFLKNTALLGAALLMIYQI